MCIRDRLYSGEFLPADEAKAIGYVLDVVEPDQLAGAAQDLARRLLAGSPFSQTRIKTLVYQALAGEVSEHLGRHTTAMAECFRSDDHREGVASFLERRPANFTGR